jgi:hypothetical protein
MIEIMKYDAGLEIKLGFAGGFREEKICLQEIGDEPFLNHLFND